MMKTLNEYMAMSNAIDAKKVWLEAAIEDGIEIQELGSPEDYSGQFELRIPRSLHRSLAEHSKGRNSLWDLK